MTDQTNLRPEAAEEPLWMRASASGQPPSLGEIGLQQFVPYLINNISLSWTTHLANVLKSHDMTTTRMRALAILSIASPVTINELSLYALTEQSTMSRTLDSLEEQGLVLRRPRAEDLRVREIDITPQGREAFSRVWPTMYELLLKMFDGVDSDEYRAFIATLHKIISNIRRHGI